MNDIDRIKTKRILEELLTYTDTIVYNLTEAVIQAEMGLSQMKEELKRRHKQISDIESILRGFEND